MQWRIFPVTFCYLALLLATVVPLSSGQGPYGGPVRVRKPGDDVAGAGEQVGPAAKRQKQRRLICRKQRRL